MRVLPVSERLSIHSIGPPPILSAVLAHEVDLVWSEVSRTDSHVTDGKVFSIAGLTPERIDGHFVPYRWYAAQIARPTLAPLLRIRPFAVSGLMSCPDGIVIGRRASHVSHPHFWELVPSGGLSEDPPDWRQAILTELAEEVGVLSTEEVVLNPVCLIQTDEDGVVDLGIEIRTKLQGGEILRRHRDLPVKEYDEIVVLPALQALATLVSHEPNVIVESLTLLRIYLKLRA